MVRELGETVLDGVPGAIKPTLRRSTRVRKPPSRFQMHQYQHLHRHPHPHRHRRQSDNEQRSVPEPGNSETGTKETLYWRLESSDPRQRCAEQTTQQVMVHQEIQQMSQDANLLKDQDKMPNEERNPWETLVIGASLGDNLSKIEHKNRQILQQKFVLEWCKRNEPESVSTQQDVLVALTAARADMADNEENNLPADQLQARTQIIDRLETLRLALERSQCKDEIANIKAAIAGYESGEIECSGKFTLIYAGEIVDTCATYESFSINRKDRLDAYYEVLGPGWLWHEPPLAGPGTTIHAKKGFCLHQGSGIYDGMTEWSMPMRFVVDENKVRRLGDQVKPPKKTTSSGKEKLALRSATFKVMLDSGSTLPYLSGEDLKHLGIDMEEYSAQGVVKVHTVNGTIIKNLYELDVGIGAGLEEEGWRSSAKDLGWPHEQGILGGLCPVIIPAPGDSPYEPHWSERLSGVFPFKVCYMSSVPTTGLIWLGENRKDVLGANRFSPYQRYGTEYLFDPAFPPGFEKQRLALGTPEGMVFVHELPDDGSGNEQFIEADLKQKPGRTTWTHIVDGQVVNQEEFGPGLRPVKGVAKFSTPQTNWKDKWRKTQKSQK